MKRWTAKFSWCNNVLVAYGKFHETDKMWVLIDPCGHPSGLFKFKTQFRKAANETWPSREEALKALQAEQEQEIEILQRKLEMAESKLDLVKKELDNPES
jgi:hypothetical protein